MSPIKTSKPTREELQKKKSKSTQKITEPKLKILKSQNLKLDEKNEIKSMEASRAVELEAEIEPLVKLNEGEDTPDQFGSSPDQEEEPKWKPPVKLVPVL